MRVGVVFVWVAVLVLSGCLDDPGTDDDGAGATGADCDGSRALEWRRALLDDDADRAGFRLTGTEGGEAVDVEMHVDLVRKELYVIDHEAGTSTLLAGEMGYATDAEGTHAFPDIGQGWFRWILDAEREEDTSASFTTPAARFQVACELEGERLVLRYAGGGVTEAWRFTAAGVLEEATYTDEAEDTDVRLTRVTPNVPAPPTEFGRWPGMFTYEILYDEVEEGLRHVGLRVAAGQNGRSLGDLTLDAVAGESVLEELPLHAGEEVGLYMRYAYTDLGRSGVLDEGDAIDIVLDATAADAWYLYDAWSGQYFEEEVVEAAEEPGHLPWDGPAGADLELHYEWAFADEDHVMAMTIPQALYDEYGKRSRAEVFDAAYEGYIPDYRAYVYDDLDDAFLSQIATELARLGAAAGLEADEVVSFTLAFVQSLEYTSDSVTTSYDEYPRYPIETLVEQGGDCEDTSILFASLVQALGYDVVMVSPPEHMAVGVRGDALPGTYYEHEGGRYYYAETTGAGWTIGEVPSEYDGAAVEIYPVTGARPTLVIDDWSVEDDDAGRTSSVWFQFRNTGAADTRRGTATVYAVDADDRVVDADECTFDRLQAGALLECTLVLTRADRTVDHVFEVTTVDGLRAIERASEYGE